MPIITKQSALKAVKNISSWGDTDVFPFPLENHILHDKADELSTLISETSDKFDESILNYPVESYSTLAPVSYSGFRWATQVDPFWNAYLLSLVSSIADNIESQRISRNENRVFSYRFHLGDNSAIFHPGGWRDFQEATRALADNYSYVVAVDISDFYSRVYHHRLENSLRQIDSGGAVTKQIMSILGSLSNGTSYGLPVGGAAARLLSELLLDRVDHLLLSEPATREFCRFADDYRFFVDDLDSAYQVIGFLSEKLLRNEGLSLQKSKTRIMTAAEYKSLLDPIDAPPGSSARFLGLHVHYDPYSDTADEDYDILKGQIEEFDLLKLLQAEMGKGRIHTSLTKKVINALRYMDDIPQQQAVLSLLDNIETLAPVVPQVMMAIRRSLDKSSDHSYQETVHDRIRTLIESSHYTSRVDLNLAYMVRALASSHSQDNELLLIRLFASPHGFSGTPSVIIQRDIMLALARWKTTYWISDKKHSYASFHPWIRRAFLVASYTLGDEGSHWRNSIKKNLSPFDSITRNWASEKTQAAGWELPV